MTVKTTVAQKCHGNFNLFTAISDSLTAISISLTAISICSRQFQFAHGNFNFTHGNFNLFTAISICPRQFQFHSRQFQFHSRQFQLAHGNFNLFTAISTCFRLFQFTRGNFAILLIDKALSIFSRQRYNIFRFGHHLSATAADSGLAAKVKTQNQKSIFQVDLQRGK